MKPIVVIPARGGSKGIPGKNIKNLGGRPLIEYTINAARELFNDDEIILSTDSLEIKNYAEKLGLKVPFIRPASLATDSAGTYDVLIQALEYAEGTGYYPEVLILLQPTSPFRLSKHLREAMEIYKGQEDIDMVVSVTETKANPYFLLFEENKLGFLQHSKKGDFIRRQDCPKVWEYNGAIYIINISSLKRTKISEFQKIVKYEMDEVSSHDLDTPLDWLVANAILKERGEKANPKDDF